MLKADQFTGNKYDSAQDKAKFGNWLIRFIGKGYQAKGFKITMFPKTKYRVLMNRFGFIAHYDRHGFFHEKFSTTERFLRFLEEIMRYPCYGDVTHTSCDMERAVKKWVSTSGIIPRLREQIKDTNEVNERATLAQLKAKYE
jgi:hypothetical protein